jgi:hypothetical protein
MRELRLPPWGSLLHYAVPGSAQGDARHVSTQSTSGDARHRDPRDHHLRRRRARQPAQVSARVSLALPRSLSLSPSLSSYRYASACVCV